MRNRRVSDKPYVIIRAAVSVDGCIDDASERRLILSNPTDFAQVDALRASCDAILVGAGTIRADDPQLTIKNEIHRRARRSSGSSEDPVKVTMTRSGDLPARARFFEGKGIRKLIYCLRNKAESVRNVAGEGVEVVSLAGEDLAPELVLADLVARGIRRLLIEGGSAINTLFLSTQGLVDELQLSVAPFFVGQEGAPRFVGPAPFLHDRVHRMHLDSVDTAGDMVVIRYLLSQ